MILINDDNYNDDFNSNILVCKSSHLNAKCALNSVDNNWRIDQYFGEFYKPHVILQLRSDDHVEKLCSGVQQLQIKVCM